MSSLPDLYTSFDVIGFTYFLRFHSVLLQVVNESICLNDEGKYCENESGCLQHATKWHHIPHNQSKGHSQDGGEGEGEGVNWRI